MKKLFNFLFCRNKKSELKPIDYDPWGKNSYFTFRANTLMGNEKIDYINGVNKELNERKNQRPQNRFPRCKG